MHNYEGHQQTRRTLVLGWILAAARGPTESHDSCMHLSLSANERASYPVTVCDMTASAFSSRRGVNQQELGSFCPLIDLQASPLLLAVFIEVILGVRVR